MREAGCVAARAIDAERAAGRFGGLHVGHGVLANVGGDEWPSVAQPPGAGRREVWYVHEPGAEPDRLCQSTRPFVPVPCSHGDSHRLVAGPGARARLPRPPTRPQALAQRGALSVRACVAVPAGTSRRSLRGSPPARQQTPCFRGCGDRRKTASRALWSAQNREARKVQGMSQRYTVRLRPPPAPLTHHRIAKLGAPLPDSGPRVRGALARPTGRPGLDTHMQEDRAPRSPKVGLVHERECPRLRGRRFGRSHARVGSRQIAGRGPCTRPGAHARRAQSPCMSSMRAPCPQTRPALV